MRHSELPFYKTGWFYLLLLVWGIAAQLNNQGMLAELEQWNREALYQLLPARTQPSQAIHVNLSRRQLADAQLIEKLLNQYRRADIAFITAQPEALAKRLNGYLSQYPGSSKLRSLLIASDNISSGLPFDSRPQTIPWLEKVNARPPALESIRWVTSADILYAPNLLDNNSLGLLWQSEGQIYPSFLTLLLTELSSDEGLRLNTAANYVLLGQSRRWPLGVNGKIFAAGESLPKVDVAALLARTEGKASEPRLLLVDDGSTGHGELLSRGLARLEQANYLSQGWMTILVTGGLLLFAILLASYLAAKKLSWQIAGYLILISALAFSQYIAFTQRQWLAVFPLLLIILPTALILLAYEKEKAKFSRLSNLASALTSDAASVFYQARQFDKLQPWLKQVPMNALLAEKLFDIALQAEAEQNKTLALKLFEWIEQSGVHHSGCAEKLTEYRQQAAEAESLDSTLVITPGQTSPGTRSNPALQIEQFGRYKVEGVLGKGAMGLVFQGVDPKINRHVAIKTLQLSDELDDDNFAESKARFFREAETAGNLSHANIVTIYDVGDEGELGYIAMDLLTGAPLSKFIKADNLLPSSLVYQLIVQITDALDYAHRQNVVHRDIKPANIIFDDEIQKATLTDFGIAYVTDQSKTRTGTIMGSPFYMSPEQVLGEKVDGRSDIFSLGVTFYQLLSGHLPFNGESIASVAFHITKSKHESIRKWQSNLPSSAVRITNKALQKDPDKRYQTMFEFKQALVSALKRDFKKAPII